MTEEYVSVYGNYANKLLRLQLDLMQALDRHRRGHKQTVEVQHVHLHSGAQGVVGIVMRPEKTMQLERAKNDKRPIRQANIDAGLQIWPKHPAAVPERGWVHPAGKRQ